MNKSNKYYLVLHTKKDNKSNLVEQGYLVSAKSRAAAWSVLYNHLNENKMLCSTDKIAEVQVSNEFYEEHSKHFMCLEEGE